MIAAVLALLYKTLFLLFTTVFHSGYLQKCLQCKCDMSGRLPGHSFTVARFRILNDEDVGNFAAARVGASYGSCQT